MKLIVMLVDRLLKPFLSEDTIISHGKERFSCTERQVSGHSVAR